MMARAFRWKGGGAPVSVRSATTDTGEPAERGDQSTFSSIHNPSCIVATQASDVSVTNLRNS
jgi:hypothetical protein